MQSLKYVLCDLYRKSLPPPALEILSKILLSIFTAIRSYMMGRVARLQVEPPAWLWPGLGGLLCLRLLRLPAMRNMCLPLGYLLTTCTVANFWFRKTLQSFTLISLCSRGQLEMGFLVSAFLSWHGWSSRPVRQCGPILIALVRSFQVPADLPRFWFTRYLPWGLTCCCLFDCWCSEDPCLPL